MSKRKSKTLRIAAVFVVLILVVAVLFITLLPSKDEINVDQWEKYPTATVDGCEFTQWGWPLPYDQVSQESIEWLKGKGWWPLTLGYFADIPGYSAHFV